MAGFLFATFYLAMAAAALIIELIFGGFSLVPSEREARVVEASIAWNYTTWLNLAFLTLAGLLVWRFLKTGGLAMLRMMNRPADPDTPTAMLISWTIRLLNHRHWSTGTAAPGRRSP
jgi:hypothetical protein